MAKQSDSSKSQERMDINHFMFGRPPSDTKQTKQKEEEHESFDIFDTTTTIVETYKQLSPYFAHISNFIKNRKNK